MANILQTLNLLVMLLIGQNYQNEDPGCIKNPTPTCLAVMVENYRKNTLFPDGVKPARGFKQKIPLEQRLQKINNSTEGSLKKCNDYVLLAYSMTYKGGSDGGNPEFIKFSYDRVPKRFKPDTVWQHLLDNWSALTATLPEPDKSDNFIYIGEKILSIGNARDAKKYFSKAVSPSEKGMHHLMKAQSELGIRNIPTNLSYKFLSPPTKAEDLINRGKRSEAIPILIQDSEATIVKEVTPMEAREKISRLRRISKLLYQAGAKEKALEIADKARDIEAADKILSMFKPYSEISQLYREIGQIERAKQVMSPFIEPLKNNCSPFGDSDNAAYAEEFVFLGMPAVAKSKAHDACKDRGMAWRSVYTASYETGQTAPDIDEIVSDIDSDDDIELYADFSAFHFNRGETDKGNMFLEKAVSAIPNQKKNMNTCSISYLAYFADRADLLDTILEKTVKLVDKRVSDPAVRMKIFDNLERCNVEVRG